MEPDNQPPPPQLSHPITLGMGKMKESDEKIWALATHLSNLVLPIIGPLIVYIVNKEESPFVTQHSKDSLNFQLSYVIWFAICAVTFWLVIPALVAFALGILWLIFTIIGGIKAHEGQFVSLPLSLPMIK